MNHWILAAEITSGSIAGLILLGLAISTIRAIIDGHSTPWIASDVQIAEKKAATEGWPHRALVALDIAINVIILRGQQDETISTHSWRAANESKTWGKVMVWWLDLFQPNHGPQAASGDLERAQVRVAILKRALGLQ